jgi:hypothetical protein
MSLKDVDFDAAFRRLAERRIEEAMQEGKFDRLPGAGKPLELEPLPADENARMTWWALRLLRQNDVIPHEVQWRKQVETLKAELPRVRDESRLLKLIRQINELIHKLNTLGTNALSHGLAKLDEAAELAAFRARR